MTRFARAKGSKSSNERVPDEATPWNVMKMQLEDSQASVKPVINKAKSAKELLAEEDKPFYHDSTGNVNHEWAAFDDVSKSEANKNKNGKFTKIKNGNKDKKKIEKAAKLHLSNDNSNDDQISEVVKVKGKKQNNGQATGDKLETSKNVCTPESKMKTTKGKKSIANTDSSEIDAVKLVESKIVEEDNVKNASNKLISNDTFSNEKSVLKRKKRAKKSKKSTSSMDTGQIANESENVTSEFQQSQKHEQESGNSNGNLEKLSKRQKRNKKKQMKIINEKNENEVNPINEGSKKEQDPKGFDAQGNDWSNEVKFGKQIDSRQSSATVTSDNDIQVDKSKNLNKRKDKLNKTKIDLEKESKNDEAQKDNNAQSEKSLKRKGRKNDNKEYKRRKPDEGVVKMIINGNEIEVVKYDGFPVKKEDAERLQELKKNMIIKGIPRSEINIAMKLERRKAEKALARERKRVCFHCRKSGHNLSDCPELGRDEAGSGICFKCGSAEHTHFECKVIKGQEFRHASCFICREQGHIARQCPDNPKGLYPQGGGCKVCGDVTHLKKDCPDLIKEKEETNITADKIVGSQLESLEEDQIDGKNENYENKIKSKIVKF